MDQVSANTDELSILRSFHAGANDFVKKPFSRHEVLARYKSRGNHI
jgi:DNA-binding response OmpR family regulator